MTIKVQSLTPLRVCYYPNESLRRSPVSRVADQRPWWKYMSMTVESSKRLAAAEGVRSPGQPGDAASPAALSSRDRFLNACRCLPVDRPPVWLMRQAGRALPEYRALKEKHSFLELVQTPELAAEVTLQPIRRFGFDAALLFSDLLVLS